MNTLKYDNFEINFKKTLKKSKFYTVYKVIEKNIEKKYAIKRISNEVHKNEEINNNKLNLNKYKNSIKYFGFFTEENLFYLIIKLYINHLKQK